MSGESANREPGKISSSTLHLHEREQLLAAIALLLGPETDYQKRLYASRCLAQEGPEILPLLLSALQAYPEITLPSWPWWPPQYEQISRLLLRLSQQARIPLHELLHYPILSQPPGPVLWTSVIDTTRLLPHEEYEPLLREGLLSPWWTVRYASAMAIAHRAEYISPGPETRTMLFECQHADKEMLVRLVASCALLRCSDARGLETLKQFLASDVKTEHRKAALFILATELSVPLAPEQKQELATLLLTELCNEDQQSAWYAARALRMVAASDVLPTLSAFLIQPSTHTRLATLIALEELASRKTLRYSMRQQLIPQHIATLLSTREFELRRQACYTLATIGGEYATAVLGTTILDSQHLAHMEAIEALRLLPDARNTTILTRIMRWLVHALSQPSETTQVCALDSLNHLIWQARYQQHPPGMLRVITQEIEQGNILFQLLSNTSTRVRLRSVELLGNLDTLLFHQRLILLEMLRHDSDSSVRACIAHTLGRASALWAIPDLLLALLDYQTQVAEAALDALDQLPLLDNELVIYAVKELAAYSLPLRADSDYPYLSRAARSWLKKQKRKKHIL
ncbi:MAG TPA: hypothetical protein VFN35_10760 [Ktedonobacteraceae bacterium]|nr:hypothetical protein [Ktedonobacteraceae bacterium]